MLLTEPRDLSPSPSTKCTSTTKLVSSKQMAGPIAPNRWPAPLIRHPQNYSSTTQNRQHGLHLRLVRLHRTKPTAELKTEIMSKVRSIALTTPWRGSRRLQLPSRPAQTSRFRALQAKQPIRQQISERAQVGRERKAGGRRLSPS